MGCDISILSRHNLNISNVETLAKDLSQRLGFRIEYGYYPTEEYDALLGQTYVDDFISMGVVEPPGFIRKMRLSDENYQAKQLLAQFGDALFDMKAFWCNYAEAPDPESVEETKRSLRVAQFWLHGMGSDTNWLNVHDEVVMNSLHYYSRWWSFCKTIWHREYFDDDYYRDFRKAVRNDTVALGGDIAYFLNDQCKYMKGVGQGEEMYYSWESLQRHIEKQAEERLVSISKTVFDIDYRNRVKAMPQEPIAFWDDFEDLK